MRHTAQVQVLDNRKPLRGGQLFSELIKLAVRWVNHSTTLKLQRARVYALEQKVSTTLIARMKYIYERISYVEMYVYGTSTANTFDDPSIMSKRATRFIPKYAM